MKKKQSYNYIWTAFSDLLSGLLLTFVLIFIYQSSEISKYKKSLEIHTPIDMDSMRSEIIRLKKEIDRLTAENLEQKNIIKTLQETLKLISKESDRIGASKTIVKSVVEDLNRLKIGARLNEKNGTIEIDESVLFAPSSFYLPTDKQKKSLLSNMGLSLYNLLRDKEKSKFISSIMVIGHADQEGDWLYNQEMSTKRANALVTMWNEQILKTKKGDIIGCEVPKLIAAGIGEARPLVYYRNLTNEERHLQCEHFIKNPDGSYMIDAQGRRSLDISQPGCKKNRRIEIMIVPKSAEDKVIPQTGCP